MQSLTVLTVRVEWIHDYIVVPVFSNIEDFRYLPEAKIYIDDYLIDDEPVSYERNGVEWTYISTVNTSYVRRYSIKYRAYFPRFNLYAVQTIVFDVVDNSPPIIMSYEDQQVYVGGKLPDVMLGLSASDNYDDPEQIVLSCDTSLVKLDQVGSYTITYYATDTSGNTSSQKAILRVIDVISPTIELQKPLIMNVNDTFLWQQFFKMTDNVDTTLHVVVYDDDVDYAHIGSYPIRMDVIDQSGNVSSKSYMIEIKDLEAPSIWLKSNPAPLSVDVHLDIDTLLSYVIAVSDNVDDLSLEDILIQHDIEIDTIGEYQVTYTLSDHSGNIVKTSLKIDVLDLEKPSITIVKPLVFEVGDKEPLWLDYIVYSDNYDLIDDLTFKLTESIDMNHIGFYIIKVEVTDKSRNKAIYQGYAEVVDVIPPMIKQLNDIIITGFEKKDMTSFFEAIDNYDKPEDIMLVFDDQHVDYETIGSYQAYLYATDQSDNVTAYLFDIIVIDIIEPELALSKSYVSFEIGQKPLDLKSFIVTAQDNYDLCSKGDVVILNEPAWDHIGVYDIVYQLMDQSNNKTEVSLILVIDDVTPPSIFMDTLVIYPNDVIDLMKGVTTGDNVGVHHISLIPETLDVSQPGSYVITYIVYDERGNYTMQDRTIIIETKEQDVTLTQYIPVGMIFLLGGLAIFLVYKKG
jgi:hypothetical protein